MAQEHVDELKRARGQLVKSRRDLASALAKPYDRGNTERLRQHMVDVQAAIQAIDEALIDEEKMMAASTRVMGF